MTILRRSRTANINRGYLVAGVSITAILSLLLTACGGSSPAPTADIVLHPSLVFSGTNIPANAASSGLLDRTWTQEVRPGQNATINFLTNPNGQRCVTYQLESSKKNSSQRCGDGRSTLVAVQSVETDKEGKVYTLIVGRALNDQITAVSLELSGGASQPIDVINAAFVLALPGQNLALRAVPVDQYGNLVGALYTFQ